MRLPFKFNRSVAAATFAGLITLLATPARAGEVYANVGFPGVGLGYAHPIDSSLTLRGDFMTLGSREKSTTEEGINYTGKYQIPELKEVFDGTKKAGYYREAKRNHLLLRPIGQRAFAGAVGVLVHRGKPLEEAIEAFSEVELWIHKKAWYGILWDAAQEVMLKSAPIAETFLLDQIGETGRSPSRTEKLKQVLRARPN